jgi:hypothetical protein
MLLMLKKIMSNTLELKVRYLKDQIIHDSKCFIEQLKTDVIEREEWLNNKNKTYPPEFQRVYSSRFSATSLSKKEDMKMLSLENKIEKASLNKDARCLISTLRKHYNLKIEKSLATIESDFNRSLEKNPSFIGMSKNDIAILEKDCAYLMEKERKKLNSDLKREIEQIIAENKCKRLANRNERSEITEVTNVKIKEIKNDAVKKCSAVRKSVLSKREIMIKKFEDNVTNLFLMGVSEEEIKEEREKYYKEIDKNLEIEIKKICSKISREARMLVAEETEIMISENLTEIKKIDNLMSIYLSKIQDKKILEQSQITWERYCEDIDLGYQSCNNDWNMFTNILSEYWTFLSMPEKRKECDRIARLYAIISREENIENEDIVFEKIRDERNSLILKVKDLDLTIKQEIKKKNIKESQDKQKKRKNITANRELEYMILIKRLEEKEKESSNSHSLSFKDKIKKELITEEINNANKNNNENAECITKQIEFERAIRNLGM